MTAHEGAGYKIALSAAVGFSGGVPYDLLSSAARSDLRAQAISEMARELRLRRDQSDPLEYGESGSQTRRSERRAAAQREIHKFENPQRVISMVRLLPPVAVAENAFTAGMKFRLAADGKDLEGNDLSPKQRVAVAASGVVHVGIAIGELVATGEIATGLRRFASEGLEATKPVRYVRPSEKGVFSGEKVAVHADDLAAGTGKPSVVPTKQPVPTLAPGLGAGEQAGVETASSGSAVRGGMSNAPAPVSAAETVAVNADPVVWLSPYELTPWQPLEQTSKSKALSIAKKLWDKTTNWDVLGPIDVEFDGVRMVVRDGTHRTLAATVLRVKVPANVVNVPGPLDYAGEWTFFSTAERMRKYFRRKK